MGDPKVVIRMERNAVIVVIHILLNNAQCMGRNVSNVRKRISSPSFEDVVVGTQKTGNPKHFSRKHVHELENSGSAKFEFDTDSVEFKCIQFTTPMFESSQDSQNIMFNEISTL